MNPTLLPLLSFILCELHLMHGIGKLVTGLSMLCIVWGLHSSSQNNDKQLVCVQSMVIAIRH